MSIDKFDLTGIAPNTDLRAANTGNFFDLGYPTSSGRLYASAVTGGGIGARSFPAGANSASKTLGARSAKGRIGWKMEFFSRVAATTSYFEMMALRFSTGADFLIDMGLRHNAAGRHPGSRNAFTYIWNPTTELLVAGAKWSFEVSWDGLVGTIAAWKGDDTSGTPFYTATSITLVQAPTNFMFFNDSNDGVDAILYDLWVSDGERPEDEVPEVPGTLAFLSNVAMDGTSAVVVGKTLAAAKVTVEIADQTVDVTPDAAGYFRAVVGPLEPDSALAAEVFVDDISAKTWTFNTPKIALQGYKLLWGSCFDVYTSAFFANAAARNPDVIANVGDRGYQYITGGTNGNTSPTDVATVRLHRETVLAAPAVNGLFTAYPESYTYSDCDGGGSNADSTVGGLATGAVQEAYRQQLAHPTLPLTDCAARFWVVDKVRFVQTDETTLASARGLADSATKTKLGESQKAWFKTQINLAKTEGQSVVWIGDGPWLSPAAVGTNNDWSAYHTERVELGAFIQASGVKLVRLHGDTHALFADNGANNPWGGFPTACAAPFHTVAHAYGRPTTNGRWPDVTTNSSRQYGVAEFSKAGTAISVVLKGYSSTNSAPTEVERYSMTVDMTPGEPVVEGLEKLVISPGVVDDQVLTSALMGNFFDQGVPADRWRAKMTLPGVMGVRPRAIGYANAQKSLSPSRQLKGMVSFKFQYLGMANTQTTYHEMIWLRTGSTNGVDVGLRNAAGRRHPAVRNATVTVGNPTTDLLDVNALWSVEVEWDAAHLVTVRLWDNPNKSGDPKHTYSSAMPAAPDNFTMGPDANDGVDAVYYDVYVSAGPGGEEPEPENPQPWTTLKVGGIQATALYHGANKVWP